MTTFGAGIKLALFALVTTACVAVLAITISGAQFTPVRLHRAPFSDATRVERARLDTSCKAPRDSETGVRGARNAPEPLPTPSISGLEEWVERYDPAIWQALLTPPGR